MDCEKIKMAIIDIKSENEKFSWVIKKNPTTQIEQNMPYEKKIKEGVVYGWYCEENKYRIYFKDHQKKSSFGDNENIYLNQEQYNHPYAYVTMLSEVLSSAIKKEDVNDIVCYNEVVLNNIEIKNLLISEMFIKYLKDFNINITVVYKNILNIKFSGLLTLNKLLNVVQLFCFMQVAINKNNNIMIHEDMVVKYVKILNAIDAPYFLVYLFLSRVCWNNEVFNKAILEITHNNWVLNYGNTQLQRYIKIKENIKTGGVLHDIGCGELFYSVKFSNFFEKVYAWDASEEIQNKNKNQLINKSINNIILKNEFTVDTTKEINREDTVLMTEVLEHMPKENAAILLEKIKNTKCKKIIITFPNGDFNVNYMLNGLKFRHDDHYWEPSYEEVKDFIYNIFTDNNYKIKIEKIGDIVDNISVATLVMIESIGNI